MAKHAIWVDVWPSKDGYQGHCTCGYTTDWYFLDTSANQAAYEHKRDEEQNEQP